MSKALQQTFVYRTKPHNFLQALEIATCYIEFSGSFLFLKRAWTKPEGRQWSVPGGKVEKEENSLTAICREVFEETKISLDQKLLKFKKTLFIKKPTGNYLCHVYHVELNQMPDIELNDEHEEYLWLSIEQAAELPLVLGGLEALYSFKALANHQNEQ